MIEIRQTGLPPRGGQFSYGDDYMRRISIGSVKKLCGMYPTPRMGNETIVAIRSDGYGGKYRLCVQNISGAFFLACTFVRVADWPEMFQVKIREAIQDKANEAHPQLD